MSQTKGFNNKEDKEFGCVYSLTFPKDAKSILWVVKCRCQLEGKSGADDWIEITGSTEHIFLKSERSRALI